MIIGILVLIWVTSGMYVHNTIFLLYHLVIAKKYAMYIFSPEYAQVLNFILFIIVYGLSSLWTYTFYVRP